MNYYLFFDSESVKRTIWLLRGKDPVTSHSNTIMDYTFYWFLSVYDYYMYSGDRHFVNQLYPRMQTMMDYVLGRTNKNGMVEETKPRIITDSACLSWMETADLTGTITPWDKGVMIHIFAKECDCK